MTEQARWEFSQGGGHQVRLWIEEDGAISLAKDGVWETRLYVGTLFEKASQSQPDYIWSFIEALELLTSRYTRRIASIRGAKEPAVATFAAQTDAPSSKIIPIGTPCACFFCCHKRGGQHDRSYRGIAGPRIRLVDQPEPLSPDQEQMSNMTGLFECDRGPEDPPAPTGGAICVCWGCKNRLNRRD